MKKLFIAAGILLVAFQGGCKKKHDAPEPTDYFCSDIAVQDTSKVKQYVIGKWKMKASIGEVPGSFHLVQESDTATYLVVYPDSTFEQYREGSPIVRTHYILSFYNSSVASDLGYGGNLWFCDPNTLITSGAAFDGPTIRYERFY